MKHDDRSLITYFRLGLLPHLKIATTGMARSTLRQQLQSALQVEEGLSESDYIQPRTPKPLEPTKLPLICGFCNKPGHGEGHCWRIPANPNNRLKEIRAEAAIVQPSLPNPRPPPFSRTPYGPRAPVSCYLCGGNHLVRDCDIAPRWFAKLKMRNEAVGSHAPQPSITTAIISTGPLPSNVAVITRSQKQPTEEPLKEREHAKPFFPDQWTYNRHLRNKMIEDVVNAQSSETLPGPETWSHHCGIPEQSAVAGLDELPNWIPPDDDDTSSTFSKGPMTSQASTQALCDHILD